MRKKTSEFEIKVVILQVKTWMFSETTITCFLAAVCSKILAIKLYYDSKTGK